MKNTAEKVTKLLIGEKVKRLRTTQALSQEKLAEKAGVDVRTIQRLENGENAKGDTLQRVAEAFSVPVTEFTLLNLDNGRFAQMSPQELSGLKESLHELSDSGRINREEYYEMRERIEVAEKEKAAMELPPLPPPPDGTKNTEAEISPNEPIALLEKLDFLGAVKRVLSETKPWVKYAPVDKDNPSLAHQLREQGFVSQPLISDSGPFRVGFFKREFSYVREFMARVNSPALYLTINRLETNEGIVIRLWPTRVTRYRKNRYWQQCPFLTVF